MRVNSRRAERHEHTSERRSWRRMFLIFNKLVSYAAYRRLEKRLGAARLNRAASSRFCSSLLQTLIHFLSVVFLHQCLDDESNPSQLLSLLTIHLQEHRRGNVFIRIWEWKVVNMVQNHGEAETRCRSFKIQIFIVNVQNNKTAKRLR